MASSIIIITCSRRGSWLEKRQTPAMASFVPRWAQRLWAQAKQTTQNIDDSPVKLPWRSWLAAAVIISALYSIDVPEHARRYKAQRERTRLDALGMKDVQRDLGDGRLLMNDGSIRKVDE